MQQQSSDLQIHYSITDMQYQQLPPLIQCDFHQNPYTDIEIIIQQNPNSSRQLIETMYNETKDYRLVFSQDISHFQFKLPPSSFQSQILFTLPKFNSKLKLVPYYRDIDFNQLGYLNDQQLQTIYQTGTFCVPSKNYKQPYIWYISKWVIKGRKNIWKSYYQNLADSARCFLDASELIDNDSKCKTQCGCSVLHGINLLGIKLKQFILQFVGFQEVLYHIDIKKCYQEIELQRQKKLFENQHIPKNIFTYIANGNESQRQILLDIAQTIDENESHLKSLIGLKYLEIKQQGQNDQQRIVHDNLISVNIDINKDISDLQNEELQKAAQTQLIAEFSKFDVNFLDDLLQLIEIQREFQFLKIKLQKELVSQRENYQRQFQKKHPIIHLLERHENNYINSFIKKKKKELKSKYIKDFLNICKTKGLKIIQIYEDFYNNKQKYKKDVKLLKKNYKKIDRHPNITIEFKKHYQRPYEIIKFDGRYSLKKYHTYYMKSEYVFWRIGAFCLQWYVGTCNAFYLMIRYGFNSSFGIKALILIEPFYRSETIDSYTGVVQPSKKVNTVSKFLADVYKGMEESRREFEDAPDTGLCGKSCSRICNLIEVYIFRFLIVGIFGLCICFPFAILVNFVFWIFVGITGIAWNLFFSLCITMTHALLYDFYGPARDEINYIKHASNCCPMFFLIFQIFQALGEILGCLILLVVFPFLGLLMFIYANIRLLCRMMYDSLMIKFISCCARVPLSETCLAWKIGGPNFSDNQATYRMSIDEVKILIVGELEKITYNEYEKMMIDQIQKQSLDSDKKIKSIFSVFNASYVFKDNNIDILIKNLKQQVSIQKSKLPKINQELAKLIQFSQEELFKIRQECVIFIQQQINNRHMNEYIYQNLQVQNLDDIYEKLLINIFGSHILKPAEMIEQRLEYKYESEENWKNQYMNAIKGKANLNRPDEIFLMIQNTQENKSDTQLKQIYQESISKPYIRISEILNEIIRAQTQKQTWNCIQNKSMRFYLNANALKQLNNI